MRGGFVAFSIFSLSRIRLRLAYLSGYVFLDWISFIHPYVPDVNVTPWNPPTGLSFALVLLLGPRFIPLIFVAPLLGDLAVIRLSTPWPIEMATAVIVGGGYSAALLVLLRPALRFNPALQSVRDLFLLLFATALSASVVAPCYVGTLVMGGLLPAGDFLAASLRFWLGDVIGVAVVAPFALIFLTRGPVWRISAEGAVQLIAIVASIALVLSYEQRHIQLFYVLFLPIVWIAVRGGLERVTAGILVAQLGLIVGIELFPQDDAEVTALQALLLVLTMTGLMAGALVTQHRRTELQLRLHQDSLARLARLGSIGEFAAAIAHEINQPLTAAGTYARLVVDLLGAK